MAHAWTATDDLVAYYLYRYGGSGLCFSLEEIGESLGMGTSALKMRMQNHKAVAGGGGLGNYSRQTEAVFRRWQDRPEAEVLIEVLRILGR